MGEQMFTGKNTSVNKVKLPAITKRIDWDRSVITILFPSDY